MTTVTSTPIWTLTFQDDFEGIEGTAPSTARWGRQLGGSRFGNNEWQSYTDGNANAFLDGKGNLIIEARKEPTTGDDGIACNYSSARLTTKHNFSQKYGRFEARMKIPQGQGIWPAFWMLGENIDECPWPACGEIDIFESIGPVAKTVYGTLHGPGYSGGDNIQGIVECESSLAHDFHVYGVEWDSNEIRWFFDGQFYVTITRKQVGDNDWPFDQPFYILLNLAVGGNWPGYPDASTTFPQRLVVDYVRAYQLESQ